MPKAKPSGAYYYKLKIARLEAQLIELQLVVDGMLGLATLAGWKLIDVDLPERAYIAAMRGMATLRPQPRPQGVE